MIRSSRIILLNGVGSAGKSSIARALQGILETPFLHVAMDAFLDMLPEGSFGRPEVMTFETGLDEGRPSIAIRTGPLGERLLSGMRRSVAALADAGNDLIVDDVMLGDEPADYARLLAGHRLWHVGILCSLEVLEARERSRGDRMPGLARWQYPRVHAGRRYDLELQGDGATPAESAARIKAHFGL